MCDAKRCAHCRDGGKSRGLAGQVVLGVGEAAVWLLWRAVKGLAWLVVLLAWVAFCWFTGRPWRHNYRGRRLVTQPVRAVGQSALAVVAVALTWQPIATGVVLAVAGGSLVASALVWRQRDELAALTGRRQDSPGEPVRVKATVGEVRRLTSGGR